VHALPHNSGILYIVPIARQIFTESLQDDRHLGCKGAGKSEKLETLYFQVCFYGVLLHCRLLYFVPYFAFYSSCSMYDLNNNDANIITWQFKNRRNPVSIPQVDGLVDSSDIAEHFKNKFSSLATTCGSDDNIKNANVIGDIHASVYDDISIQGLLFNVEDVDTAIFSHLQRGKAPELDSLSLEHFIHAHPLVITHLNKLFNLLIRHGYVPNLLGEGVIVPLLKDKNGDISSSENYRAITINSVLAKIFETCVTSCG